MKAYEKTAVDAELAVYRDRLCNLSWFMKCLNEPLARIANKEDNCTGTFWEARYKSQALCTDEALLGCMAYVDLNPIRAAIATTPEDSAHTSIRHRLNALTDKPTIDLNKLIAEQYQQGFLSSWEITIKPLLRFNHDKNNTHHELPFNQIDYLQLVEWTGRIIRNDKRGFIDPSTPDVLDRLTIEPKRWLSTATRFEATHRQRFGNRPMLSDNRLAFLKKTQLEPYRACSAISMPAI